jgi:hypothetical protein
MLSVKTPCHEESDMRRERYRHQLFLDKTLPEKLEALGSRPGATKSAIMAQAFAAWVEHLGASEIEGRFGVRLDRQQRAAERLEAKVDTLTELVGVFVQHQLTLVAHQTPFDADTAALGRERFARLLDVVERCGGIAELSSRGRAAEPEKE